MSWWQRFVAWLTGSALGGRREQVEDWIENNGPKIQALVDRQRLRRISRGHFFQRLRGWAKPSDDSEDQPKDLDSLPSWCDLSIDVYEAPDGARPNTKKGWRLNVHVTEADDSKWTLTIDSLDGSLGWAQDEVTP